MERHSDACEPADGVRMWIADGGSIMFKAVTRHGDPAELVAEEARSIARALLGLADRLEADVVTDDERLGRAVTEAREEAKEQVRRQMRLP